MKKKLKKSGKNEKKVNYRMNIIIWKIKMCGQYKKKAVYTYKKLCYE